MLGYFLEIYNELEDVKRYFLSLDSRSFVLTTCLEILELLPE